MPVCSGRRVRFSGASARSTGRDSKSKKDSIEKAALAKGFSTINEYLDSLGKNDRSLCKTLAELYQECINDNGNSSHCDNYYKRLSSCPDFEKGKYLQTPLSEKYSLESLRESFQKKAAANGFSTIEEYFDDADRRNPNMCRLLSESYKKCIHEFGTGSGLCVYQRERMSFLSCPEFKKGTDSRKKKSS